MSMGISLSALNAFGVSAAVTANNVANVNTPDFKASRADLETGQNGQGVRVAAVVQDRTPGPVTAAPPPQETVEASNVDLGREMVDLIQVQNAYAANAATLSAQDQLTGYVLDMLV